MIELYNCPLCGAADGYDVEPVDTRWVSLACQACGDAVTTIKSKTIDPEIYYHGMWNEAGAYAHRMKIGHDKWIEICKHFLGACHD